MAISAKAEASLAKNYNPIGALGGLFAPAYVAGYAPAENAVMDWQQGRGLTGSQIDETSMPVDWTSTRDTSPWAMGALGAYGGPQGAAWGPYGPNLSDAGYQFGLTKTVDPAALRAASQNAPYDVVGRREAIAQQVMRNEEAKAASAKAKEDEQKRLMDLYGMQQSAAPVVRQGEYLQD